MLSSTTLVKKAFELRIKGGVGVERDNSLWCKTLSLFSLSSTCYPSENESSFRCPSLWSIRSKSPHLGLGFPSFLSTALPVQPGSLVAYSFFYFLSHKVCIGRVGVYLICCCSLNLPHDLIHVRCPMKVG